jgi:hypothetical protein
MGLKASKSVLIFLNQLLGVNYFLAAGSCGKSSLFNINYYNIYFLPIEERDYLKILKYG